MQVRKLDANDYTTAMTGLKFKLAHKRDGSDHWSASANARRNRLVQILEEMIERIKAGPAPAEEA